MAGVEGSTLEGVLYVGVDKKFGHLQSIATQYDPASTISQNCQSVYLAVGEKISWVNGTIDVGSVITGTSGQQVPKNSLAIAMCCNNAVVPDIVQIASVRRDAQRMSNGMSRSNSTVVLKT